jgi:hypothetical protein
VNYGSISPKFNVTFTLKYINDKINQFQLSNQDFSCPTIADTMRMFASNQKMCLAANRPAMKFGCKNNLGS